MLLFSSVPAFEGSNLFVCCCPSTFAWVRLPWRCAIGPPPWSVISFRCSCLTALCLQRCRAAVANLYFVDSTIIRNYYRPLYSHYLGCVSLEGAQATTRSPDKSKEPSCLETAGRQEMLALGSAPAETTPALVRITAPLKPATPSASVRRCGCRASHTCKAMAHQLTGL